MVQLKNFPFVQKLGLLVVETTKSKIKKFVLSNLVHWYFQGINKIMKTAQNINLLLNPIPNGGQTNMTSRQSLTYYRFGTSQRIHLFVVPLFFCYPKV